MPSLKKKQSLQGKLNTKLKTPKSRMLATVLVFAIIGGGIFVYRSFAATQVSLYNLSSRNMEGRGDEHCIAEPVKDNAGKATIDVLNLRCPRYADGWGSSAARSIGANGTFGQKFRACAWIKGGGRASIFLSGGLEKGFATGVESRIAGVNKTIYNDIENVRNDKYYIYCTAYSTITSPGVTPMQAGVQANRANSFFNVSSIEIQRLY